MHATAVESRKNVSLIFGSLLLVSIFWLIFFLFYFKTTANKNNDKHFVDVNQSNVAPSVNKASSPGVSQDILDQIQRPSVDSLLDELSNARSASPVYAVPHDGADGKPKSGRHVTITVRETTTERVSGTPSQCEYKWTLWLNGKRDTSDGNFLFSCITLRSKNLHQLLKGFFFFI